MARYILDQAGKKAHVRSSAAPGSEVVGDVNGYVLYVDQRTGRYFAVAR
jgi:hypothetical protein